MFAQVGHIALCFRRKKNIMMCNCPSRMSFGTVNGNVDRIGNQKTVPCCASSTAGSTSAKSAMTNFRFSSIFTVWSANWTWISCDWIFFFSASCWSLNICLSLALAASFFACSSCDLTANDFCISSTCSTVSAILFKPTFRCSCCSSRSLRFSEYNFTK